jgi:hypothetical protein
MAHAAAVRHHRHCNRNNGANAWTLEEMDVHDDVVQDDVVQHAGAEDHGRSTSIRMVGVTPSPQMLGFEVQVQEANARPMVVKCNSAQGAESQTQNGQSASEQADASGSVQDHNPRPVREAWLLAHPTFPASRPGLFKAVLFGLGQAAQSWHMHQASNEIEHERNRKIIISEATNGALISALFITISAPAMFDPSPPENGMQGSVAMTNLYYSLHTIASFCFAISILYSLTLLLIMESTNGKDASDLSHALGVGIHWPITNFVAGVLLLLGALFLKGYYDVSLWVWILGWVIITLMVLVFFAFLGSAVQAQWDVMDHRLRGPGGTTKVVGGVVLSEANRNLGLLQEWITQLPEIDETKKQQIFLAFQEDLVDVETLVELNGDDFLRMGVSKIGWQKNLLRKGKQEMVLRGCEVFDM